MMKLFTLLLNKYCPTPRAQRVQLNEGRFFVYFQGTPQTCKRDSHVLYVLFHICHMSLSHVCPTFHEMCEPRAVELLPGTVLLTGTGVTYMLIDVMRLLDADYVWTCTTAKLSTSLHPLAMLEQKTRLLSKLTCPRSTGNSCQHDAHGWLRQAHQGDCHT